MTAMNGFDRFQGAMSAFTQQYIDPAWKSIKATGKVLDRPTDHGFSAVFYGFLEISNAIEALKLCETLIGVAPPRSKAIKRDEYFQFLVGAYLQEMYILQQRLSSYAKKMTRLYKRPHLLQNLELLVNESLGVIVITRGSHVHAKRYSDRDLEHLSTLTLISQFDSKYLEHTQEAYWIAQQEWGTRIKANNRATQEIVNQYFDELFSIMASEGKFVLPRAGKSPAIRISREAN